MIPQSVRFIFRGVALALLCTSAGFRARGAGADLKAIPESDDYVLRVWGVDDGMPYGTVASIAQTPDGYLWLATSEGLARFDGVRFRLFLADNTPGVQSDHWQTVFTDHDGSLWLGMEGGGISRRSGGKFEVIAPVPPRTSPHPAGVSSIVEDRSGAVWFGYSHMRSACRWQNGQFTFFDQIPADSEDDIVLSSAGDGTIWYTIRGVCGLFDGQQFRSVDNTSIVRLAAARDGRAWGVRDSKLVKYAADGKWEAVADLAALGGALNIRVLHEDDHGDLWLGTVGAGLFRFHNGSFAHVATSHLAISSIFEDREGSIWVGTEGGGLDCLRVRRFSLRQIQHGLSQTLVTSLCEDSEGKLWLLDRGGRPVRSLDSTNSFFAAPPGLENIGQAVALCPDSAGGIWLAMSTGGVRHWRDGENKKEPVNERTTALLRDRNGDLWVAAISGPLLCLRGGIVTPVSADGGLVEARSLAEDDAGRLWVGTEDGLVFCKDGDRFAQVPLPGLKGSERVQFIVADGRDQVWIGLERAGLYRWRAGKVDRLPATTNNPITKVRSMVIEPGGSFWIGTTHGLLCVQRAEIEAVMSGRQQAMRCVAFGRNDGLPHIEFSYGFRNVAVRARDGHLWFATYTGALDVMPSDAVASRPLSPVRIEEIEDADGRDVEADGSEYKVQPHPGALDIHYTLPSLSEAEQIAFRYRLVGLGEGTWIWAGNRRMATFTSLPPGQYQFEVQGAEPGGNWSSPASASVVVLAAWWESVWFRFTLAVVSVAGLIATVRFIVRRRMQARMRALEQEHALERERARIARDIHDELGANLTQISIASKLAEFELPEPTSHHVREIASMARSTVDSLDEIVWAVNPRYDSLSGLIEYIGKYSVSFLQTSGISCLVDFPPVVPPRPLASNLRHHLFLVAKEALNNIVKYAGATEVSVKVEISDELLRLTITDNGCGFEVGAEQDDANGLRNMRQRMAEMNGICRIESALQCGTRVCFELPF